MLWTVSGLKRLRACGRATTGDTVGIHVLHDGPMRRATATGLATCGSIWSCPVCAAHIRQVRALDIAEACRVVMDRGGSVLFLTLTFSHHQGEALAALLDGLLEAWRKTIRGTPWAKKRAVLQLLGLIKSVEVTIGENGWHPHLHLLLLCDGDVDEKMQAEFTRWLLPRWQSMAVAQGLGAPDDEHGLLLERAHSAEDIGVYVAKVQDGMSVGLEMARGDLKVGRRKGRTPFELLDAAGDGEADAIRSWREYEIATKGRRAIVWSPGLRDALGMGEEQTDDEVVAETEVDEETLLVELANNVWWMVCRHRMDARLLAAAEDRGLLGVQSVVTMAKRADRDRREVAA